MEIKKTPKADLENKKSTWMLIGYVIVLAFMFIAFEWTKRDIKIDTSQALTDLYFEEEMVPITEQEEKVAPPPPEVAPINETLEIVADDADVEETVIASSEETGKAVEVKYVPVTVVEEEPEEQTIFEVVEQMPEFPDGGMSGLMQFLSKNIRYPVNAQKNGTQGRVTVQFVVNADGSISNIGIIRGVDPELDGEAVRVISTMPNWKPGMQKGKAVRVKYTVPVMFRLSDNGQKEEYKPVPKIDETVVVGYVPKQVPAEEDPVFEVVENMPEFPGGMGGLMQYLSKNIKYPVEAQKAGIQGRVIMQVIIDENGNVTNPKVTQPVDPLLDTEAIRVTASMPKWKPGTQRGMPVNVKYTFPIVFRLQ